MKRMTALLLLCLLLVSTACSHSYVESDEAALELNGAVLTQDVVHTTWKDPRIFSWDAPPFTVTPVAMVKNLAAQKLTRLVLLVPADILKRGDNSIVLSVNRECSSHLPNNLR